MGKYDKLRKIPKYYWGNSINGYITAGVGLAIPVDYTPSSSGMYNLMQLENLWRTIMNPIMENPLTSSEQYYNKLTIPDFRVKLTPILLDRPNYLPTYKPLVLVTSELNMTNKAIKRGVFSNNTIDLLKALVDDSNEDYEKYKSLVDTINKEVDKSNRTEWLVVGDKFKVAGKALWDLAKRPETISAVSEVINNWAASGVELSGFTKGVTQAGNFISGINPALGAYVKLGSAVLGTAEKIGSRSLKDYNIDLSLVNLIGGSYSGTVHTNLKYSDLTKKDFGAFSGGYGKAKRLGEKAIPLWLKATDIAKLSLDIEAMRGLDINFFNYLTNLNGTFDPRYFRDSYKNGAKIKDPITLVKERRRNKQVINVNAWKPVIVDVPEFKDGGIIELEDTWQPVIVDEVEKLEKGRTILLLIDYAKLLNPRFILRMSEPVRFIEWEENGEKYKGTHLLGYEFDGNNWYVFPSILEINGELKRFTDPFEALDSAKKNNNFLIMSKDEAKLFTESGEDKDGNLYGYKAGWPEFFKFQKGGKTELERDSQAIETTLKNVIPEGALHAHKHHMDNADDLTKKGIPVIDNNNNLLAEIERNEIIFSLEVTKKLEELKDKYFSEDFKLKDKDLAAIEAGQLLVLEILFNTEDRTDLINSIEV